MATDWTQPIPYREEGELKTFKHTTVDLSLDQADSSDHAIPVGKEFIIKKIMTASSINVMIEVQVERNTFEREYFDFIEGGKPAAQAEFSDTEGQGIKVDGGKTIHVIVTGRNDTQAADAWYTIIGVMRDV